MLRWYLILTKPSAEAHAVSNLQRQGYEVYFPRAIQSVQRCGGWRERIVPLFPRYLFLRIDEGRQSMSSVRSTIGVSNTVRFGSRYAVVPDQVVSDLRALEHPDSRLHRLGRPSRLVPGASVRITSGAFKGLEGLFDRADGAERVVVLLQLLGQEAAAHVPTIFVVPSYAWEARQ
jgi:transcriptional antiterminator RfaH